MTEDNNYYSNRIIFRLNIIFQWESIFQSDIVKFWCAVDIRLECVLVGRRLWICRRWRWYDINKFIWMIFISNWQSVKLGNVVNMSLERTKQKSYLQWTLSLWLLVIHSDIFLLKLTWQVLVERYLTSLLFLRQLTQMINRSWLCQDLKNHKYYKQCQVSSVR